MSVYIISEFSLNFLLRVSVLVYTSIVSEFLCRLRRIAAYRDQFVRLLSVCLSVITVMVVTHNYVSQEIRAFLGMLPLCLLKFL